MYIYIYIFKNEIVPPVLPLPDIEGIQGDIEKLGQISAIVSVCVCARMRASVRVCVCISMHLRARARVCARMRMCLCNQSTKE